MKGSSAVQAAARRILAGDESVRAANLLESAILLDHGDDADLEELVYVLSVYSPEGGREYSGAHGGPGGHHRGPPGRRHREPVTSVR